MTPTQAVRVGAQGLWDRWRSGQLHPRNAWWGCVGAAKYLKAKATGDEAEEGVKQERAVKTCGGCKAMQKWITDDPNTVPCYCGSPGEPLEQADDEEGGPVCGCLVAIMVNGEMLPAGKTEVASEECPRQKWGRSTRARKAR